MKQKHGKPLAPRVHVALLVAGRGSRMAVTEHMTPKHLLAVNGTPILKAIIDKITTEIAPSVVHVYVGHLGHRIRQFFAAECPVPAEYVECDIRYGPFHSVHNACRRASGDDVLAIYGDVFAPALNFRDFVKFASASPHPFVAAVGASLPTRHAAVFEANGTRLVSWRRGTTSQANDLMNMGCYFIRSDARVVTVLQNGNSYLEDETFPKLISGGLLGGYRALGRFINVNTPGDLASAQTLAPNL